MSTQRMDGSSKNASVYSVMPVRRPKLSRALLADVAGMSTFQDENEATREANELEEDTDTLPENEDKLVPKLTPFSLLWSFGRNPNVQLVNLSNRERGVIAFASGHAGVLYDFVHDTMQLVQGHQNCITGLSTDGQGRWLVSAAKGKGSVAVVWDVAKLLPIRTIYDPHSSYGMCATAMSPDGKYLVTVGNELEQMCHLWLWTFGRDQPDGVHKIGDTGKTTKSICFNVSNTRHFMITQQRAVIFGTWDREVNSELTSNASEMSVNKEPEGAEAETGRALKLYRCAAFWKGAHGEIQESCYVDETRWALSCTSKGYVYVFSDDILDNGTVFSNKKNCIKIIKLQNAGINTICCVDGVIATGNDQGHIRFYDKYLRILYWCQNFDLDSIVSLRFSLQARKYVLKDPTDFSDVEGWNLTKTTFRGSKIHCCDDATCCNDRSHGLCTDLPDQEDRSFSGDIVYDSTAPRDASMARKPFIVRDFVVATRTGRIGHISFLENRCDFVLHGPKSPVTAIELHPENHMLIVGNSLGHLSLYNYSTRACLLELDLPWLPIPDQYKDTDPPAPVAVTYLKYSTLGTNLACGTGNGSIWFLHPSLLTPLTEKPETQAQDSITEIEFSSDDCYMAASDESFAISVFKRNITKTQGYSFYGIFRSHYGSIVKILFGNPRSDRSYPRLLTVGEDRMMIEYNLEAEKLSLQSGERIEQSAIPTAASWYLKGEDNLIIIYEDQCKYKIINDGTGMTMGTYLGPTYGSPVRKIIMLPDSEILTDSPGTYKYFVFATDKHLGLQTLPPDGNPYKSVGMVGHPTKLTQLRISCDGLHLFTIGEDDPAALMWQINPRSADLMSKLGGTGLDPFLTLLEGGENGWIYREMQDMFYYSQILHQGENTDEPRRVSHIIPLNELADLLRAVGVYPSEYEVENLTTEVTYQNRLAAKMGELCTELEVTFDQFVRLYVNHRSVNGIPLNRIKHAFATLAQSPYEPISINKVDFLDALCNKGESPGRELIKQYLMELTGTKFHKKTDDASSSQTDMSTVGSSESSTDSDELFYGTQMRKERYKDFTFLPDEITCDHFIDNVLGIETNSEKIKSFTEAIRARQYMEPVLIKDDDDEDSADEAPGEKYVVQGTGGVKEALPRPILPSAHGRISVDRKTNAANQDTTNPHS